MNTSEYKRYHEAFMQNNHGTSAGHTFFCIFFTVQCTLYVSIKPKYSSNFQYIYEYLIIILPMILAHTLLAEYIYFLNLLVFLILLYEIKFHIPSFNKKFLQKNMFLGERIPFVTTLRALTYIITALAILAVDFQVFPRYLAKTERFGYSLMDTGVGLFVLMSGLVHKDLNSSNYKEIIKGNLKVVTMLLFLGVGRFLSIKQLDYQEHVAEYGVHWNFFFTIAICKMISTFVLYFTNRALTSSILILLVHECILYLGVQDWVLSDTPRETLVSANREGISSSLGYVSLYLFSVYLKQALLSKNLKRLVIQYRLVLGSAVLWIFSTVINFFQPASRTLANAGYCIYMETVLLTVSCVMYFVATLTDVKDQAQNPYILSIVNSNGLLYFLTANLLTGLVNLSIRTLLMSGSITFAILNVYMIVTIVIIAYAKGLGFRI